MYYSRGENRRKRWYRLLSIGQKKLLAIAVLLFFCFMVLLSVIITYHFRAQQYDIKRVGYNNNESMLYDCDNKPLASLSGDSLFVAQWQELPSHLINAFVAREDESFFQHGGVVYTSVIRSLIKNVLSLSYEQGASTITMQLTRNVYELSDKTLDRKILEAMIAQQIEEHYDKQTILLQYLNRIYFGQGCYGVAAAANRYFGKAVSELNLVECATLAGLVRAPSLCNPVTDMKNAMGVKRETLSRMLALGYISQEEHDNAVAERIVLSDSKGSSVPVLSYPSMRAQQELEELRDDLGEHVGGIAAVSNLQLELQKQVELAAETALVAVEKPGNIPDSWLPFLNANREAAERQRRYYDEKVKRPAELKVRGTDNEMAHVLQCCVLVVDSRRNNKGRVLAMVSGRSAVDGRNRWEEMSMPGKAISPFLYQCACLPGGGETHIVARNAEVTGRKLGYDVVSSAYKKLGLGIKLPNKENADALYRGEFFMKRIDLARILFDIQNEGRNYKFSLLSRVWSRGGSLLYTFQPEVSGEYIRREGAGVVSKIAPFIVEQGKPIVLNENLPSGGGCMCMVFNNNGVAVFVWIGFDDLADMPDSSKMAELIKRASYCLASEIHAAARAALKERSDKLKKQ